MEDGVMDGAIYGANVDKGHEESKLKLATLVGSRICHDLISPIGAVQNGVELLEMSKSVDGPELPLIADSISSASTRARFFRVAYGGASVQMLGKTEIKAVLDEFSRAGRLKAQWNVETPQPRAIVRLVCLVLQCCESAMPKGGTMSVTCEDEQWLVTATAPQFAIKDELWQDLMAMPDLDTLAPSHVQFALLPLAAEGIGRFVSHSVMGERLTIKF